MHIPNLLPLLLLHFLIPFSHSQTITPSPSIDQQQSPSPTTSLNYFSALAICNSAAPCTSYPILHDACVAEYDGDDKYLYCLCTTGYYDLRTACDACSVSLGIGLSEGPASLASGYRKECGNYGTEFGANVTTVAGTGIMGGLGLGGSGMVSVTGTDEGGLTRTSPTRYPSSPIGVTTRISKVGSDVPFGGLVSTGSDVATATATGSENRGVRTGGLPGRVVLPVAIPIMFWAMFF